MSGASHQCQLASPLTKNLGVFFFLAVVFYLIRCGVCTDMDSHCYHLVRNDAEQPPKRVIDTSVEYDWPDRNITNEEPPLQKIQ